MKEKKSDKAKLKKDIKKPEKRRKVFDYEEEIPQTFTLHVGAAVTPDERKIPEVFPKIEPEIKHTNKPVNRPFQKFHKQLELVSKPVQIVKEKLGDKIWGSLRFISTSAIIFIVLFFIMNWNAYSAIVLSKLGFVKTSDEMQELLPVNGSADNPDSSIQDLMVLSKNPEEQKSQIPPLNLEVIPPDTRIVIPRIAENVPIITVSTEALVNRDWDKLEQQIQESLRDGVVHYPGTAFPGEKGNVVITGHSSYFVWDPGRFKDVFALLQNVEIGDRIYVFYNQKKYVYEVYDIKVVLPTQVDILTQAGEDRLTLITCTPVGTNLKRLVVLGRPVL